MMARLWIGIVGFAAFVGAILSDASLESARVHAVDHLVAPLADAPPTDDVPAAIQKLLGGPAFKVTRGESRTVCEIWLCKQWPLAADAQPKGDVIYPFQPGQILGVARYPRKAADFRDQSIASGIYTIRYGQQPVDGAHVGTSPTRDFLVLIRAADEQSVEPLDYKTLITKSAEAAGSKHPLLLSLQRLEGAADSPLSIRHREEQDWWIVRVDGESKQGDKVTKQPLELVVVGHASE